MQSSDKVRFKNAMDGLCVIYSKEANKILYKMYYSALEAYPIEQIEKAIEAHTMDTKSGQFWPKPADIIKHLNNGKSSLEIRNEQQRQKWLEKKRREIETGMPAYAREEIERASLVGQ